jgi:adenylate cyclase class 2
MPSNLELKAVCRSLLDAQKIARKIRAKRIGVMHQTDTYFRVSHGRLKLREIRRAGSELIYYRRPNRKGSRFSDYIIAPVGSGAPVKKLFRSMLGERAVVQKTRRLYLYKNARIHLDQVEGLGSFIEFEVLNKKGKRQAQSMMFFLKKEFGIKRGSIIAGSYSDLIWKKR